MRPTLKGAVPLFVFLMALLVMPVSNANAVDTELFISGAILKEYTNHSLELLKKYVYEK